MSMSLFTQSGPSGFNGWYSKIGSLRSTQYKYAKSMYIDIEKNSKEVQPNKNRKKL